MLKTEYKNLMQKYACRMSAHLCPEMQLSLNFGTLYITDLFTELFVEFTVGDTLSYSSCISLAFISGHIG